MPIDGQHAIPTSYNGQEFKSRLEANVAWLLDALRIEWEYEPQSFLLPNGEHYCPDFWCPAQDMWVEARGYDNPKGRRQINGFLEELYGEWRWGIRPRMYRPMPSYIVVGPHNVGSSHGGSPSLTWGSEGGALFVCCEHSPSFRAIFGGRIRCHRCSSSVFGGSSDPEQTWVSLSIAPNTHLSVEVGTPGQRWREFPVPSDDLIEWIATFAPRQEVPSCPIM